MEQGWEMKKGSERGGRKESEVKEGEWEVEFTDLFNPTLTTDGDNQTLTMKLQK